MAVNDFLFELGCEELPSGAVWPLAETLAANLTAALDKAQLGYGKVKFFATPRRLAVLISKLQDEQPKQTITRRGPPLAAAYDAQGEPTPALLGFAKSCEVEIKDLATVKTDKGTWLVYEVASEAVKTKNLLPAIINQVLVTLPIAKPMRWGDNAAEFARPVHWAVMLLDDEVVAADIFGVKTGRCSYGHRFHHPQAVEISKPQDYESFLREAFVIADFAVRREEITKQVEQLATSHNAQALMPSALVDEVTSIVEWPQALLANFPHDFLEVPAEALIASMQSHQKCFALQDSAGKLLPHFITVANIVSSEPQQVLAGNEKVMRARLSDAAFFFQQDKKHALSEHIPATGKVIFQAQLGSLQDKAQRMQLLINQLVPTLQLDPQQASRAALLSKCDLLTGMVGEFPELQGLMGYYYARHDGEADNVAVALNEQYMPRFSADDLPRSALGLALSLVDRLDTLVGIFAIGQKPSGVKDPFKLRRHALAVVRLLLLIPARINLSQLLEEALKNYGAKVSQSKAVINELHAFILERLQSYYHGQGFNTELVQAVRVREENWLYDFDKRLKALAAFRQLPEAAILSAAGKRVNNLLQQAKHVDLSAVDENLLEDGAEKSLYTHLCTIEKMVKPLYETGDYGEILEQLTSLREPIDAFFEQVMVMVDNVAVRMNRLRLLAHLQAVLQGVADISLL